MGYIAKKDGLVGKEYDEILFGLRGYPFGRHIIFFTVLKTDDILIVRILHERMDYKSRLQ